MHPRAIGRATRHRTCGCQRLALESARRLMLTTAGAKLLDFGLAKLRKPGTVGAEGFSRATTQSGPVTADGSVLGTLPYIAPEQLHGKQADPRTDVFAFGTVVYEMITGERVFKGDSEASLIAAILDSQPDPMSSVEPTVPCAGSGRSLGNSADVLAPHGTTRRTSRGGPHVVLPVPRNRARSPQGRREAAREDCA